MNEQKVNGIVEAVKAETKSLMIKKVWYSGKFSYQGEMPNKGDEVEITVVPSVSKTNGQTYLNIKSITIIKANTSTSNNSNEFRLNVDCGNCLQRATELVIAGKSKDLGTAIIEVIAAFKYGLKEMVKTPEPLENKPENQDY